MPDLIRQISDDLLHKIDSFQPEYEVRDVGTVIEAGDGIARADGLSKVRSQELVQFSNGVMGIAFNLEERAVGVIILGDYTSIKQGMLVYSTGRIAATPVGPGLIGRVVNAVGQPVDGKGGLHVSGYRPIERIAPGVIERKDVDTPVQTGVIAIDTMIPIGRGQRELIIGDRQTGKTAIAIDTIIHQKDQNLICIYVAIGQKKSAVARTLGVLERFGAMEHTVVVLAAADEPAAMQYLAPYTGCAIGEEFMERGQDALIIYDDLSKHAWAYRQVSLLMRRPPGREAYPGDVFYLHSRLLERACRLADQYVIVRRDFSSQKARKDDGVDGCVYDGPIARREAEAARKERVDAEDLRIAKVEGSGGSLTALPIIETLLGDVSAYIPTNVISITDGQIYLENDLFNAGIRPAINVGISVSRVGGDAQTQAIRQVASRLRLDMASYRSMAAFSQFGSDLDKGTLQQITRGQRLQEILKQPQYEPISMADQVVLLYAGIHGYADSVLVTEMRAWQQNLLRFVGSGYPEIGRAINSEKRISVETETKLKEALKGFNSSWTH
jgi:F-type H+-transporting ATPase subunit alpha